MLFHEITPFADANRDLIVEVRESISSLLINSVHLTDAQKREKEDEMNRKLQMISRAFNRFEACAIDEWKMKERLERQREHCRLNHRDQ